MASLKKRGNVYYAQYYRGNKAIRVSLRTTSLQIAKEKLRKLESSIFRQEESLPFPTKTPVSEVVSKYITYMEGRKTARSLVRDIAYLRDAFGPVCPALALKKPAISAKRKGKDKNPRGSHQHIDSACFEQITTSDISSFIATQVRRKALAPKTANRYREILTRVFNWAMEQNGIRMPGGVNPAAKVERYKEKAPQISFLSLDDIDCQLKILEPHPDLQVIVAVYIFAGLRREELCWLTTDDIDLDSGTHGMIRVRAKTVKKESWEPKTKVNRAVPISSRLRSYLDGYQPPGVKGGWYFSTPNDCRWDPDNLSHRIRKVNREAGLEWGCLDFRHTFGSHLAMKGESLYKISALMGNSPEICRRHYAALVPESLVESVEFAERYSDDSGPPNPERPRQKENAGRKKPRLRLVINRK